MSSTFCLYIDDDEADRTRGVAWQLEAAFQKQYNTAELALTAKPFDAGEQALREDPDRYHLVVIDIFDESGKERGWAVIQSIRERANTAVVAISQVPGSLAQADVNGAHALVDKNYLARDRDHRYLRDKLVEAFTRAGVTPPVARPPKMIWDDKDLPLAAAVYRVGEDRLVSLVLELCEAQPDQIELGFVRAGLSGALVLYCYCTLSEGDDEEFLIKASRDGYKAQQEVSAWNALPGAARQLFPSLVSSHLADSGGWYALGIGFCHGVTLTEWLTRQSDAPSDQEVAGALSRLFLAGGLSTQYVRSKKAVHDRASEVLRNETLLLGRQARILIAIKEMQELVKEYLPDSVGGLRSVENFFRYGQFGGLGPESLLLGTCTVRTHGDLHGRNVLVGGPQQAVLLDPADMVFAHPATDWARLTVDVLLTGFGANIRSHEWESLKSWRLVAGHVIAGVPVHGGLSLPNGSAFAVDWLRAQAEEIFAGALRATTGRMGASTRTRS